MFDYCYYKTTGYIPSDAKKFKIRYQLTDYK